jgi:hypothetical protein
MNFCSEPFSLGSSCTIQKLIQHSLLHPIHHQHRSLQHWSRLRPIHHCSSLPARINCNFAETIAAHTIPCITHEIGGGRCVVFKRQHLRRTLLLALKLLPCLLNGNTHLLPTSNGSHLNIGARTRDYPLQASHDIWIALYRSVVQDIDGCVAEDVLDDLILGAGVNLLEFLDGVVIKIVLEIIKKRATDHPPSLTWPSRWACLSPHSSIGHLKSDCACFA